MKNKFDKNEVHGHYLKLLESVRSKKFECYDMVALLYNTSYAILDMSYRKIINYCIDVICRKTLNIQVSASEEKIIMITYPYKRNDHSAYWKHFQSLFSEYGEYIIQYSDKKEYYSGIQIFSRFNCLLEFVKELKVIPNIWHRFFLAGKLLQLFEWKTYLNTTINEKNKVMITFFDSGFFENLAVQNAKLRGIKTVTLQHGMPVYRGTTVDRLNQSIILNFTSDYTICAGNFSKKQYLAAGYAENQLQVLGTLKQVDINIKLDNEKKIFGVFLDVPGLEYEQDYNMRLIEMAEKISKVIQYRFYIKPHPADRREYGKELEGCIGVLGKDRLLSEYAEELQFGITHASAIMIDLICYGVKPFRMKTDYEFPIVMSSEEEFSDSNEFIDKLDIWNCCSKEKKEEYFKQRIEYYLNPQDAEKKHIQFINSLLQGEEQSD